VYLEGTLCMFTMGKAYVCGTFPQSVGLALATSSSSVHYLGNAPRLGIFPMLSIQKGFWKMNYYELFLECCYVKFCFVVVCFSLFFRVGVPSFSCFLFGLLIFC
jgi:hypothetical protein